ncbi:DUF4158 domain-containing protein [Actinopolyspora biskrensis]|uniref:DUF4158 domain-containing protein n=1 Tax=Actinopolyspora biskrensis TaxID=1470178 RepID=UPI0031B6416C
MVRLKSYQRLGCFPKLADVPSVLVEHVRDTQAILAAVQTKDNPADLINVALEELVRTRCELPGYSTLDEMAATIRTEVNTTFFVRIAIVVDEVVGGDLDYRTCDVCQVGIVEHVRVDARAHRRRLASRALHTLVAAYPDYTWRPPRSPTPPTLAGSGRPSPGPATLEQARHCPHMRQADQHIP